LTLRPFSSGLCSICDEPVLLFISFFYPFTLFKTLVLLCLTERFVKGCLRLFALLARILSDFLDLCSFPCPRVSSISTNLQSPLPLSLYSKEDVDSPEPFSAHLTIDHIHLSSPFFSFFSCYPLLITCIPHSTMCRDCSLLPSRLGIAYLSPTSPTLPSLSLCFDCGTGAVAFVLSFSPLCASELIAASYSTSFSPYRGSEIGASRTFPPSLLLGRQLCSFGSLTSQSAHAAPRF